MATDRALLSVDDVHAHYGLSHVLQGGTFDAPEGLVTVVVGRNGVGKTTLINTIMGLVPATHGRILLEGRDIRRERTERRREMGISLVPQGRRVFRSLTVDEHVRLVKTPRDAAFTRDRLYEIFPRLKERQGSLARNLSGGEQSMLSIARALTTNPRLLLMDEPTEGLAPLLVETVRQIIRQVRDTGVTVVLVEQNLGFALDVADRVIVMQRGRVQMAANRADVTDLAALSSLIMEGVAA